MCKCLYVRFGAAESDTEASLHSYEALLHRIPTCHFHWKSLEESCMKAAMPQC
jgi:hypothetical protein